LEATEQVARQGLKATEQATRQAELRSAVLSALGTTDYDGLTLDEISERLEGLSAEQLEQVREFEKQGKDRETLVQQIDRKIRANNS
jgi:hypothetical protein